MTTSRMDRSQPSAKTALESTTSRQSRTEPVGTGWRWLRSIRGTNRTIVLNAGSLVGTFVSISLLGAAFWWFAARHFAPEDVGFASAAVSGMTLLAGLSTLGLGTMLMGELGRQRQAAGLLTAALIVAALIGSLLGIAYAVSIPRFVSGLRPLAAAPSDIAIFVTGIAAIAVGNALDAGLIGLMLGRLQLIRNIFFGIGKLVILVVFADTFTHSSGIVILAAWALAAGLAVAVPGAVGLLRAVDPLARPSLRPRWRSLRGFGRAAAEHQILNLALVLPSYMLPLIVVALLSTRANASFYIAWMIAGVVFFISSALTQILFAVGTDTSDALSRQARMTMGISLLASCLAIPVVGIAARPILELFGTSYAHSGTTMLQLIVVAAIPLCVKNHYLALVRIRRRLRRAMPLVWGGAVAELALAALGAKLGGLEGLAIGWVAAVTIEAALMGAPVYSGLLGFRRLSLATPLGLREPGRDRR